MKSYAILMMLSAAAVALPAQAAFRQAEKYEQAAAQVNDAGYILFVYGKGWDKRSEKLCRKLMASPAVQAAAGDAVCMLAPLYQSPTEEQKAAQAAVWGKLQLPHVHSTESYPAILLYGRNGQLNSRIIGDIMYRGNVDEIAAELVKRTKAFNRRETLMKEASAAKGKEKAVLIGKAASLRGIEWPYDTLKQIREADPDDASGYIRRLSLNSQGFAESSRDMKLDEGLAEMDKRLKDPAYSAEQKQVFCAIAIGLLSRQGSYENRSKLRSYAARMKKLNPDTPLGKSAEWVAERWAGNMSISGGWSPENVPPPDTPVRLSGDIPISAPGTYTVKFEYRSGSARLDIACVELRDGNKVVCRDQHAGFTGDGYAKANVYTLNVTSPVASPRLYVTTSNPANNRKSAGKITVSRVK